MTLAFLVASVLGAFLLVGIALGKYEYTLGRLFVTWVFATVPLKAAMFASDLGLSALSFRMEAFALSLNYMILLTALFTYFRHGRRK